MELPRKLNEGSLVSDGTRTSSSRGDREFAASPVPVRPVYGDGGLGAEAARHPLHLGRRGLVLLSVLVGVGAVRPRLRRVTR